MMASKETFKNTAENIPSNQYEHSKEVSLHLDIASSTLRKWCISLAEQGYNFTRGEQNRRLFIQQDLEVLNNLKELVQVNKFSLENASIVVASRFSNQCSPSVTPAVPLEEQDYKEVSEQLTSHIKQQEQFNNELLKQFNNQSEYLNKRMEQRDQVLVEVMNEVTKQRKADIQLIEQVKTNREGWLVKLFQKLRGSTNHV